MSKTRELSSQELLDFVDGVAVYSTGGGGDHELARPVIQKAIKEKTKFRMIDPNALSDKDVVVVFGVIWPGGRNALAHINSEAALETLRAFEKYAGKVNAIMVTELGGIGAPLAMDTAARAGLPIVDADSAGRAKPSLRLNLFSLNGVPLVPFVMGDATKETIVIFAKADTKALGGQRFETAATFRLGLAYQAYQPVTGGQVKSLAVHNTISKCIEVGKTIRQSREKKMDVIKETLKATRGEELFRGKLVEATSSVMNVEGSGAYEGSRMKLTVPYEFIAAYKDEKPVALSPDLITMLSEDGSVIPSERANKGQNVVIIGIPASNKWRTRNAILYYADFMKGAGITDQYVPVERLSG